MASSVPAVKAALLTILGNNVDLNAVSKSWAGPTRDEDYTGEMVFLGEVNNEDNWQDISPQLRRNESYRLAVTVWVEQWGDDPQAAEERVYTIWGEVTETLRDDFEPAGAGVLRAAGVLQYGQITFRQITGPATPEKWGARIDAQVTFTARNV
jgi:hypothetical protein